MEGRKGAYGKNKVRGQRCEKAGDTGARACAGRNARSSQSSMKRTGHPRLEPCGRVTCSNAPSVTRRKVVGLARFQEQAEEIELASSMPEEDHAC